MLFFSSRLILYKLNLEVEKEKSESINFDILSNREQHLPQDMQISDLFYVGVDLYAYRTVLLANNQQLNVN